MAKNFIANIFGRNKDPDPAGPKESKSDADAPQTESPTSGALSGEEAFPARAAATETQSAPRPQTAPGAQEPGAQEPEAQKKETGWLGRLRDGLRRSSTKISDGLTAIFKKRRLDAETLEELEELLISADIGVTTASKVTAALAKDRYDKEVTDREVREALAEIVAETLVPYQKPLEIPASAATHVILVAGVNGAGKTTTIGKLAARLKADGKSVSLAAGDTFRAAAIDQLRLWGERVGAPVVSGKIGADAAGLAYDALKSARETGVDVLIVDTAGRLQNKSELMDELAKIVRVLKKIDPDAPHDTLLVLDATVGQNALSQAEAFKAIADVTGLVMTKLDGSARGGVLVSVTEKYGLPIHFVGVGEDVGDLQPFNAAAFAHALAGVDDADELRKTEG